ncbi:MAG: hypothetical protein ACXVFN_10030 [Solirubrobacteraceae bacterium]
MTALTDHDLRTDEERTRDAWARVVEAYRERLDDVPPGDAKFEPLRRAYLGVCRRAGVQALAVHGCR